MGVSGDLVGMECDCAREVKDVICDLTSDTKSSSSTSLEVRWMTTGNVACSLNSVTTMSAADVMAQVQEHAGVPMDEQRLFADGHEFNGEDVLKGGDVSEVTLVRTSTNPCITDLGHFHSFDAPRVVPEYDCSFEKVNHISKGINGCIFKYKFRGNLVAVKKVSDTSLSSSRTAEKCDRTAHMESSTEAHIVEDSLAEIGVLSYLSKLQDLPLYLMKLLDVVRDQSTVWLVTEYLDGGDLYNVAASRRAAEVQARKYMWQLLQGLSYLHRHHIGHRDVSLENIMLKGGNVRLIDFGQAVRSHSSSGTPLRFFRPCGKDFYRPAECYVPQSSEITVHAPPGTQAGDIMFAPVEKDLLCEVRISDCPAATGSLYKAEPWGYQACPADLFSLGICMYILVLGNPPWDIALRSSGLFAIAYEQGLDKVWKKFCRHPSQDAGKFLVDILTMDPALRPTAETCLEHPWFANLSGASVPTH